MTQAHIASEKLTEVSNRHKKISFAVSTGDLASDLPTIRPQIVFGSASNSLLECMMMGGEVVSINVPGTISLDPLADLPISKSGGLLLPDVLREIFGFDERTGEERLNIVVGT